MTLPSLAVLFFAATSSRRAAAPVDPQDDLPSWERLPVEQRWLADLRRRPSELGSFLPPRL